MMKFVAVVLISTVLAPSISAAALPNSQPIAWEAVEKLPLGARLRLVFTDASIATGKLVRLTPTPSHWPTRVRGGQGSVCCATRARSR